MVAYWLDCRRRQRPVRRWNCDIAAGFPADVALVEPVRAIVIGAHSIPLYTLLSSAGRRGLPRVNRKGGLPNVGLDIAKVSRKLCLGALSGRFVAFRCLVQTVEFDELLCDPLANLDLHREIEFERN